MKILQILYPGLGGTSTVAFSIVDSQKYTFYKKKINNFFIFHGVENLTKNNSEKCKKEKIKHFFIPKNNFIFDTFIIYKKIKLINPDIILTHSNSLFALLFYRFFFKKRINCIDHTPDFTRNITDWIKFFLFSFLSDRLIFVSEKSRESFVYNFLNFFKIKFNVILNSVDTDKFIRTKKILENQNILIGMAARFVDDKRQELLLNTLLKNKIFFINNKIKISFAGSGYNLTKNKNFVNKNHLKNMVDFNGNLSEKKLINWFNNIDIYFHLSNDETTSTSILQAMSMSLPIFASKVEGNKNLAKYISKKLINLVNNNEQEIIKKINFIVKNKKKIQKQSIIIRKIIIDKLSLVNFFKKYYDVIKD